MPELFTSAEVRDYLASKCDEAGGAAVWAAQHGFTYEAARVVISGTRPPGPGIASALGFEKVTMWRPVPASRSLQSQDTQGGET